MQVIDLARLSLITEKLPANPRVLVSGNFGTPFQFLTELDLQLETYRLNMLNAQPGIPDRPGVTFESAFVGAGMRNSERLEYFPGRLSLVPRMIRTHTRPDLVVLHTSTPRAGLVSLGNEVNVLPAAIESARKHNGIVVAVANPLMPYTFGDSEIPLEDIDYLVELSESLRVKPKVEPTDIAKQIGQEIATRISDGSTLQLGIGAIPDAVLSALSTRRGIKIWTEMFSDGVLDLRKVGALDVRTHITASFVFGSEELYDWINLNPRVRMRRTEVTNSSGNIGKQQQMISINAALQVDLFDQANSSRINDRIYSGFGGSTDFIIGALKSKRGLAFMALPSWHAKSNSSTIVPKLIEPVTSFQHSYVVTEHGAAHCAGASQRQQALNIIHNAAHPDAREDLLKAAKDLDLV
jgi:acyl-CoA hydrolase